MFIDFFDGKDHFDFLLVFIVCLAASSATVTINKNCLHTILNLELQTFKLIKTWLKKVLIAKNISCFRTQTCLGQGIFPGLML